MKKSILLCCIAALTVGNTVSAAEIDAQLVLRRVDVRVTDTKESEIPTIQLLNSDKTKMLYTDEGKNENGSYIFDSFSFPLDAATGDYILRVGEDGSIWELPIKYTEYNEALLILENIKEDSTAASAKIGAHPELFGTNAGDFAILGEDWKKRIEKEVSALDIKYENESEATLTVEGISEIVQRITDWARLTDSESADETEKAIKAISGLDLTYREKLSSVSGFAAAFKAQQIDKLTIDKNGILSAFDGAMLVSVINECDWGTGKAALNYYVNKGLLSVDSKYLSSGAAVYKALKEKQVLDYKQLPAAIKAAYESTDTGGGGGGSTPGGTTTGKVNSASSLGGIAQTEAQNRPVFNDLGSAEWAREAIEALAERKIVSGRGNGIFAPNDSMTRAEFVKLIVDAFDLKDDTAKADFDDVPNDAWFCGYIASAKKAGIINGVSDRHFGVSEPISRQDMAVILMRAAKLKNIETSGTEMAFSDSEEISDYAREAVAGLTAAGILNGMDNGAFSPLTNVTRAQGAQVIYTMLCRKG